MPTYVCSDIHGHFNEWMKLIETCKIDLENGDRFFILGDIIDRGPHSKACVDYALHLKARYPDQVIYLMGNHEQMMLQFLQTDPANEMHFLAYGERWTRNGGLATINAYLGNIPEAKTTYETLQFVQNEFHIQHPDTIEQLSKLPYYHLTEDFAFVHAGFQTNIPLKEQDPFQMAWIRDAFYETFQAVSDDPLENKTIIHGHTPIQNFPDYNGEDYYDGKHHIGIDGGAAARKKIIMLKIDETSQLSAQTLFFTN